MENRDNVAYKDGVLLKAGGLIIRDGKMLLVSSNNMDFVIPKGHVENGETIEECAIREIREETGFETKIVKEMPYIEYVNPSINQPIRLQYFIFEIIGGGEAAEEGSFLKWFDLKDALRANPYDNEKTIIRKAYE